MAASASCICPWDVGRVVLTLNGTGPVAGTIALSYARCSVSTANTRNLKWRSRLLEMTTYEEMVRRQRHLCESGDVVVVEVEVGNLRSNSGNL